MKTENHFLHWLYGASFYHGTTRYGQFSGCHVFATSYDPDDDLRALLDNLEGGDEVALDAGRKLSDLQKHNNIWMAWNDNPTVAMMLLVDQLRVYYFAVLNGKEND